MRTCVSLNESSWRADTEAFASREMRIEWQDLHVAVLYRVGAAARSSHDASPIAVRIT